MLYRVVTIDAEGSELRSTEEESFVTARDAARGSAKDRELIEAGAVKVLVYDQDDDVVLDRPVIA